ncbi:hypothetical protein HA378_29670 [Escherichia coli]|nr:hypothetical protein [Escherichia coli]
MSQDRFQSRSPKRNRRGPVKTSQVIRRVLAKRDFGQLRDEYSVMGQDLCDHRPGNAQKAILKHGDLPIMAIMMSTFGHNV